MKKIYSLFLLMAMVCLPLSSLRANELTVADGTATNSYLPLYGLYMDADGTHGQLLYPADMLATMENGAISKLTFYLSSPAATAWTSTINVSLGEIAASSLASAFVETGLTQVYSGTLDPTGSTMVVTLASPYEYSGGNLVVDFISPTGGNYKSATFSGINANVSNMGRYGYNSYGTWSESAQSFLPKVTFEFTPGEAPACAKPKSLAASEITNSSAKITWTSEASAWKLQYQKDGAEAWTEIDDITSAEKVLSGLDAATKYNVKVQAVCDEVLSDPTAVISFETELCDAKNKKAISYQLTDSYGDGWSGATLKVIHKASSKLIASLTIEDPASYYDDASSKEGTLDLCCGEEYSFVWVSGSYDSECSFVITNTVTEDVILSKSNPNAGVLLDYVMNCTVPSCKKPTALHKDGDATAHTVTLAWTAGAEETAWQIMLNDDAEHLIDADANPFTLTGLAAETAYAAKVRANCGEGDDDKSDWSNAVNFTTAIACHAPVFKSDSIKNITATTADLVWGGDAEGYKVSYRTAAYADGFLETFDASSRPATWTLHSGLVNQVVADPTKLTTTSSGWTTTSYALGAYNMRVNVWGTSCKYWLVSPEVTIASGDSFRFDLALTDNGNANPIEDNTAQADDRFVVLVFADGAWHILREWNNEEGAKYAYNSIPATGQTISDIDIAAYVGKAVKFAFYGESTVGSNGDNDVHIDNVLIGIYHEAGEWVAKNVTEKSCQISDLNPETLYEVKLQSNCGAEGLSAETAIVSFTTAASCPALDNLAASEITTSSAKISWDAHGESVFNLQYRKTGADEWTTAKDVANNHELEGLSANTAYQVRVQPTCADDDSWSEIYSFRTECDAIATFPWSENFNGQTAGNIAIPCWENEHIAGNSAYLFKVENGTGSNTSKVAQLPDMQAGNLTLLSLPEMNIPTADAYELILDVYRKNYSTSTKNNEGLRIYVSATSQLKDTVLLGFIPRERSVASDKIAAVSTDDWYTYNFTLPVSGACRIFILGVSEYGAATNFDNLIVREIPTCSKPTVAAPVINPDGAAFSWTAGNGETQFQYACVEKDAAVENWTLLEDGVTSVTISGKASGVDYDFYVRAYCSASDQSEAAMKTFAPLCPAPTALTVSEIGATVATISWTAATGIANYQYVVMPAGEAANWESAVLVEGAATASLTELEAATSYVVYVRSYYSAASQSAAVSKTFTTGICEIENQKAIRYEIWDTYGDGWQGASLRVTHKATNVEIISLTVSSSDDKNHVSGNLNLCCGEEYLFTWVSGTYDSECRLAVYDINDEIIIDKTSAKPTAGTLLDYTMDCTLPSCAKPSDLAASSITANSVSLNWTENGEAAVWQISLNGDEDNLIDVTAKPYVLSGLDPNTEYSVKVRANCDDEDKSDWSAVVEFTTACEAFDLPFVEDFESDINCWTLVDCHSETGIASAAKYEGENGFKFRYSTTPPQYLISPELETVEKDIRVEFYYKKGGNWEETFKVGYSTTTNATDAFTWGGEINAASTWEKYEDTIKVAGVKFVAIQYTANDKLSLYIDNFSVKVAEPVGPTTALEAIESKGQAVKFIRENNLYIKLDGVIYDATGRKVEVK